MALPKVDLSRWEFLGNIGTLLLFEDKLHKRQFKLFPAAVVVNGSVGQEPTVLRARSLKQDEAAIAALLGHQEPKHSLSSLR